MTWERLDYLPDGWKLDKTAGSPVHGYVFATNGKSVLNGQMRALVRVSKVGIPEFKPAALPAPSPAAEADPAPPDTVNTLARKQFILRMLADIRFDLAVCEIEGWSKTEYIDELHEMLSSLRKEIKQ